MTESNPDFSFGEMAMEIRELLAEGEGVATSTIKNFYQRKTNPRRSNSRMGQQRKEERSGE